MKHYIGSHNADVAELADALDLGSSVPDVQVQVLSSALMENSLKSMKIRLQAIFIFHMMIFKVLYYIITDN